MADSRLVRSFLAFWWVLGLVLIVLSVETVWSAIQEGGTDIHAIVVGTVEAIAAVLFLIPRCMRTGAILLLVVISVVFLLHLARGHFSAPLLVYAAGVVFVMIHGPVRSHHAEAH